MEDYSSGGHGAKHFTYIINLRCIPTPGMKPLLLSSQMAAIARARSYPVQQRTGGIRLACTHLLNSILLASHLSHLADALNMILKVHLEAAGKCQVGLGPDIDVDLIGQYLPVPVPHTRVAQALDQRDVWLELLYTCSDVKSHLLAGCGVGRRARKLASPGKKEAR